MTIGTRTISGWLMTWIPLWRSPQRDHLFWVLHRLRVRQL